MAKYTNFNRSNIAELRNVVAKKLQELEELGIVLELGSIKYSDLEFSTKLSVKVKDSAATDPQAIWNKYCMLYNMSPEDYRTEFQIQGRRFTFVKFDTKKYRFPIIMKDSAGKQYKMPVEAIKYRKF